MTEQAPGLLLLDTHVWIWLFEGDTSRVGSDVAAVVDRAAAEWNVRVSTMSVWEVAMLAARRRVTLSFDCDAWVRNALDRPGVRLESFTPKIAIESTRLPNFAHRDPADRILIATARVTSATLVTRDRRILDYAAKGYLRVLDATPRV